MNARLLAWIIFVFIGCTAACVAQSAGSVTGWGDDTLGQLPPPSNLTNIVAVSAGSEHSAALRNDGTVAVWGRDNAGQISTKPSNLGSVAAIAAGGYHTVALRSNGTVVAWGMEGAQTNVPPTATGVKAIAAGDYFGMALKSNGAIVVWGAIPSVPSGLGNNVTAIAAGAGHALALTTFGTVVAWGANGSRQTNVPVGLQATQIAAGESHSLALRTDGRVVGWGINTYGQSTNGAAPSSGVRSIFAGKNHSGAFRSTGAIVCWGDNNYLQATVPPLTNVFAVASGGSANHNLAIVLEKPTIATQPESQTVGLGQNATFTVVAAGSPPLHYQWRKNGTNLAAANGTSFFINNAQPTDVGGYSVVVTNSVGSVTSVVANLTVNSSPSITAHPQGAVVGVNASVTFSVTAAGTAPLQYRWQKNGTNIAGATGTNYQINNIQMSHAAAYSVTVSNLYGVATSSNAVLTVIPPPVFVVQPVSQTPLLGSSVTLRTMVTNAESYQWTRNGTNIPGATSTNFTINRLQTGDAGNYQLVAWNDYGTNMSSPATLGLHAPNVASDLMLWGESAIAVDLEYVDMTPPLGITNVLAVAMGAAHNLALRADGRVVGWGDNQYGQAGLPPNLVAAAIAAGANHTLAITNGKVGAWGLNDSDQASPPGISDVLAIAAAGNFSIALQSNGLVHAWGAAPLTPSSATNIMSVAAGIEHVLGVRQNGTVLAWGGNTYGQVRAPFAVTNANAGIRTVAAGSFHSLALRSNGTVIAWGKGTWGQTNVPPEATNVIAIAAGGDHSIALRADGVVVCWGYNNWGQSEAPPGLVGSAIAGAGDRTLAVGRERQPMFISIGATPGGVHLVVSRLDGLPIQPAQLSQITVWAIPALGSTSVWAKLTNTLSLSNGAAILDDTRSEPQRFYIVR